MPELRRFLEGDLPEYMVPAAFVLLDALPLNASGKIDRAALPAPESAGEAAGEWVPPATHLEELLARVTADLLGLARVGLRDNFFDLGGHSLLLVKLHAALKREFATDIALVELFQRTTVAGQADRLVRTNSANDALQRAQQRARRQALD